MDSLTAEAVSAKLDLGGGGQDSAKNKNIGHFGGSAHYHKIKENVRSIYNVHKISMDEKHFEVIVHIYAFEFILTTIIPYFTSASSPETSSPSFQCAELSVFHFGAFRGQLHWKEYRRIVRLSQDKS